MHKYYSISPVVCSLNLEGEEDIDSS